ncbi:unnamed protein product [Linum trigynum]|uniref:Uncharacterized protein n=1 Tax=Linum trigynum TaxID=586398 RepID=A0AAV2GT87_9ROSI
MERSGGRSVAIAIAIAIAFTMEEKAERPSLLESSGAKLRAETESLHQGAPKAKVGRYGRQWALPLSLA